MLKRMIPFAVLLLLLLTGCGANADKTEVSTIEAHSWQLTSVQSMEAEGQIIAYGPGETSTLDTAVEIVLTCTAEAGKLTLSDETNGKTYTGEYKLTDMSQESMIYEISIDKAEGMAVVSTTTYHNERESPTLIINLGDYALNFFADTE